MQARVPYRDFPLLFPTCFMPVLLHRPYQKQPLLCSH